MRLNELRNTDIKELAGVGAKAAQGYAALEIKSIADLLEFKPKGYEDRTGRVCIGTQVPGGPLTNTYVQVISKSRFGKGLNSVKALVEDTENGVRGELLGFNRSYLDRVLFPGSYYRLYGNMLSGDGIRRPQFSQFEVTAVREEEVFFPAAAAASGYPVSPLNSGILPVYPLAGTLTQKSIRRDIKNALSRIDFIEDDLPAGLYSKYGLISRDSAVRKLHFPESEKDITEARRTLAFTEVFYLQMLAMRRPENSLKRAIPKKIYRQEQEFISSLPFELTPDQITVLDQIRTDMSGEKSMNRLLQGDVGSGKTLVAWVSALHAIVEGRQVAFMAPTELLARQHAQNAAKLFEKTGVSVAFLDGAVHGKPRQALLEQLKEGNIDLIIGTHALFSKDVVYKNLGYVIIDEQHRFGVEQRSALFSKGEAPDILLMTATPIPRTLALTVYGSLNVSSIKTMPAGRLPVKTFTVGPDRRAEMYRAVGVELERGHRAYFVCPRIEEEENSALRSVEEMYAVLQKQYPAFQGALIHSRIPEDEKADVLDRFAEGNIDYLVATSVVEVGIDVPEATCMVIEHADVFGLSALHQLRGRVGRSSLQSWCFLVYGDEITEDGKKRLAVLWRTNNGFEIAEEDLKLRGPGELTGLRQSGFSNLKFASLDRDIPMMARAREEVARILEEDPGLISLENSVIRRTLAEL